MKEKTKNVIEGIMTFVVIIMTIIMVVVVMTPKTNIELETRQIPLAGGPEVKASALVSNDDPTEWAILDITDDFSMAKIQKKGGGIYWVTVYRAYDNIIVIKGPDGTLHEFYFYK